MIEGTKVEAVVNSSVITVNVQKEVEGRGLVGGGGVQFSPVYAHVRLGVDVVAG